MWMGLCLAVDFHTGDHMTSGHVFAQRLHHGISRACRRLLMRGKLMLGICNGFQVMTKMGLLPGLNGNYFSPSVSLYKMIVVIFRIIG